MAPTISNSLPAQAQTFESKPQVRAPATAANVAAAESQVAESGASEQIARDMESVRDAVRESNEAFRKLSTGVEFSLDEGTGRVVVRVIAKDTNEILRQIPSEEMLAIARAIDRVQGLLIQQEV